MLKLTDQQRRLIKVTVERYKGCETLEHLKHLADDVYGILFSFDLELDHDDQVNYAMRVGILVTRYMNLPVSVNEKAEWLSDIFEKVILNDGEEVI